MNAEFKRWATPVAIATFIISAFTGVLIFFHVNIGFVKPVHEWLSWALLAGVILHIAVNWKQFLSYFSRQPGLGIIAAGILIAVLSVSIPGGKQSGNPVMRITRALESASLSNVAGVAGLTPEAAVEKLEKKGIAVSDDDMSIKRIAAVNGKKEMNVLAVIFE
jgi:hypothetical protein